MAVGGRKPKPAELHVLTGNFRSHRHEAIADTASGSPVRPAHVRAKVARQIWDETVARAPWLTEADSEMLAMYCLEAADYRRRRNSWTAADRNSLRIMANELGLTGAGRARVPNGTKGKDGKKDGPGRHFDD